ncbi:RNA polymerase-associated factor [Chamberlinius hualienensis]
MAPTIQTGHHNDVDKRQRGSTERRSELVGRVKYCNQLPDIPFDPKFITYPFDSNRFVQYNPTSLERNYKHDLLTEHDLGVSIDLINTDTYAIPENGVLDPADEKLLEEEVIQPQNSKRSRHHAKSVSWLRRTEYISTELTRFQASSEKNETKVGYNVKRFFKEQDLYMDRESQIKAIDKTFEDSKKHIEKHHTKPSVVPVEELPVFADFDMWKYPCAQVIFDSDPAPMGRPLPAQLEEMSQAMIRGVMDESGEQFVAYFLPTEETIQKRKRDVDNGDEYVDCEEYDYKMAREYNWNVKNKASKGYEENYFFVFRDNNVYYNELETRVRLSKRRIKAGSQPNNSRLVVCHRPLNEAEFKAQEARLMSLEPQQEEEEAAAQQPDDEEEKGDDDDAEPQTKKRKTDSDEESDNEAPDKAESEAENDSDQETREKKKSKKVDSEEEASDEENDNEAKEKGEESDNSKAESDGEKKKSSSSSSSSSGSSSSSSGSSEDESEKSSSDSESDAEDKQKKRDEEEIFGSASDSD